MRYLLDTDHCSYLQRKHPEVVTRFQGLRSDAEVMTSVISQAELLVGIRQARSERRQGELRSIYEQLLRNIADVLPVTSEVAEQFAEVLVVLLQKGKPIPVNDIWIAAMALANDLILVSGDEHFQHVEGLRVEDWTKSMRAEEGKQP
jgi:tRNA(fMet)-specific endonuclease VapC